MLICLRTPGCEKLGDHDGACQPRVVTAPDVRTAAQAEAKRRHRRNPDHMRARVFFVRGAVWGAALVTPTREQIAKTLRCHNFDELLLGNIEWDGYTALCACGWFSDEFKMSGDAHQAHSAHAADAVMALMQELAGVRGGPARRARGDSTRAGHSASGVSGRRAGSLGN